MKEVEKTVYLPGLNGLRAIAALSVLFAHISQEGIADFGLMNLSNFPMAGYGVTLFFVISGFLISFLLIKEIEKTKTIDIKKFYLRRILRIWPIYYLFIAICFFALYYLDQTKLIVVPEIWYYIFFSANIPFVFQQGILILVHYWSIGVEEQFYLFWPWLVRLSKKNILKLSVVFFVLLFSAKLFSWVIWGVHSDIYRFLMVTRFHCMMLGAIGAFVFMNNYKIIIGILTNKLIQVFSWLLFLVMGFGLIHIPAVIGQELVAFISLSMILSQVSNKNHIFSLENKYFDFIGKISYGIYVIHPLIILLLSRLLKDVEVALWLKYPIVYGSVISLTIILAWVSYSYYEKPFLKLKTRFAVVKSSNSMLTS